MASSLELRKPVLQIVQSYIILKQVLHLNTVNKTILKFNDQTIGYENRYLVHNVNEFSPFFHFIDFLFVVLMCSDLRLTLIFIF